MAKVASLIRRSLRLIRAIDPSEVPTAHEEADTLQALNAMLKTLGLDEFFISATETINISLSDGDFTVGTGGDVDTPALAEIRTVNGSLLPLSQAEYLAGVAGFYYNPSKPFGILSIRGVPVDSLQIVPTTQLAASNDIALPDGYEEALTYALAIRIAPEFGKSVSPEVAEIAARSMSSLKRFNAARKQTPADLSDIRSVQTWR